MAESGCLKDGLFQNASVNKLLFHNNTSSPTGTATVLTDADSGSVIFMDASSANTVTLPAISTVKTGWHVKVILTVTGNAGIVRTGNSLENKKDSKKKKLNPYRR